MRISLAGRSKPNLRKKFKAPDIGFIYNEIPQTEQTQTQHLRLSSLKPCGIAWKYKVERMSKKRESKEEKNQLGEDILHVISWGKPSNDI